MVELAATRREKHKKQKMVAEQIGPFGVGFKLVNQKRLT